MKIVIFLFGALVGSSSFAESVNSHYTIDAFQDDVAQLMPLATELRGACQRTGDPEHCATAESLSRVLRELALSNPSGQASKLGNSVLIGLFESALVDGVAKAMERIEMDKSLSGTPK